MSWDRVKRLTNAMFNTHLTLEKAVSSLQLDGEEVGRLIGRGRIPVEPKLNSRPGADLDRYKVAGMDLAHYEATRMVDEILERASKQDKKAGEDAEKLAILQYQLGRYRGMLEVAEATDVGMDKFAEEVKQREDELKEQRSRRSG